MHSPMYSWMYSLTYTSNFYIQLVFLPYNHLSRIPNPPKQTTIHLTPQAETNSMCSDIYTIYSCSRLGPQPSGLQKCPHMHAYGRLLDEYVSTSIETCCLMGAL